MLQRVMGECFSACFFGGMAIAMGMCIGYKTCLSGDFYVFYVGIILVHN